MQEYQHYFEKTKFFEKNNTIDDYIKLAYSISVEPVFDEFMSKVNSALNGSKNLNDNNWIKFTNKGKAETKLVKEIIKVAVQTAESQIAEEKAAKEAAKKERALARAQERAAQKAASKE